VFRSVNNLTVELGPKDNVISIEVKRKHRFQRNACQHHRVDVDETLANVMCRDCGKEVNAIAWIVMMTTEWWRVKDLYQLYKDAAEVWEAKQRTQCQHCKKLTPVNAPSEFSQKMRERGHVV